MGHWTGNPYLTELFFLKETLLVESCRNFLAATNFLLSKLSTHLKWMAQNLKKENIKVDKIGSVTRKISRSTLRKKHKMTCSCPFLITSLVKMKQLLRFP